MDNEDQSADEFLATQGTLTVDSIDQLEEFFKPDSEEPLKASSGVRSAAWVEMQQARAEYLREWEEDMRFAQELASEGM
jgi:hypothetical protein